MKFPRALRTCRFCKQIESDVVRITTMWKCSICLEIIADNDVCSSCDKVARDEHDKHFHVSVDLVS